MTENPVVVFENVSKSYQVGEVSVPALSGISLKILKGRFSMVLGPSGSGKTTLLNMISCIDVPTEGTIAVCGENVAKMSDNEISEFRAKYIGFIFQNFNLIPVLSALENVEYPLTLLGMKTSERRGKSMSILESVGLSDHAQHRPNQLSGGQKQRVAIARALVKGPILVLADEPTANLDTKTGASIIDLMHQVQKRYGATFLFSTHDPQLISHAQDVFSIRDGKLIEQRAEEK